MTPTIDVDYVHKFVPAHPDSAHPVTLIYCMETGGDENSLLSLGNQLCPRGPLGLRGKVLENGMPPRYWKIA